MKKYQFILLIPFLLAGGCSGDEDKATPDQPSQVKIFTEQRQALEKAKGVEGLLQKSSDDRLNTLDEQSQ